MVRQMQHEGRTTRRKAEYRTLMQIECYYNCSLLAGTVQMAAAAAHAVPLNPLCASEANIHNSLNVT